MKAQARAGLCTAVDTVSEYALTLLCHRWTEGQCSQFAGGGTSARHMDSGCLQYILHEHSFCGLHQSDLLSAFRAKALCFKDCKFVCTAVGLLIPELGFVLLVCQSMPVTLLCK